MSDIPASILRLSPAKRRWLLGELSPQAAVALAGDWGSWAHDGQLPPEAAANGAAWRTWVIMAGRGFGKTRAGAEWVADAARDPAARIALVGATIDEARDVMVEGRSGLLGVAGEAISEWRRGQGRLRFASGAEASLFSGASPERLRGPEHSHAWCDELAKWARAKAAWDVLQLGLRLGAAPRAVVTTTPKGCVVLEGIVADPATAVTRGATFANPHLSRAFVAAAVAQYGGTRMGEMELLGRMPGAKAGQLFTKAVLEEARVLPLPPEREGKSAQREGEGLSIDGDMPSPGCFAAVPSRSGGRGGYLRLVIGVDPPAGGGTCGILVCAVDREGVGHVLADASVAGASPEGWAGAVLRAWRVWACAAEQAWIVAEVNQGGDMVSAVLRHADAGLARVVRSVRADRGKAERAVPIALLFEQGRVRLHERFEALEAELLRLVAGERCVPSPDRADAMVWALDAVMGEVREPGVFRF